VAIPAESEPAIHGVEIRQVPKKPLFRSGKRQRAPLERLILAGCRIPLAVGERVERANEETEMLEGEAT
jgi:hypothetical protein